MKLWFLLCALGVAGPLAAHEGGKDNCRVTLQTYYKDGKRKVEVTEVHVDSHTQCKDEATRRKLSSEGSDDEDISRVNVIFAYRDIAVVGE